MLGITTNLSMPIKQLMDEVPERIVNVRRVVGRAIADKITEEVQRRIPRGTGWYGIYRNAIAFKESPEGDDWAIAGFSQTELSAIPAETSLVYFNGAGQWDRLLMPYNPWPIDMIPVINKVYSDKVDPLPTSEATVAGNRDRLQNLMPTIHQALIDAGASILGDDADLSIGGKPVVDLSYLAQRLELGYGGFPRHPHWGPTTSKANTEAVKWGTTGAVIAKVDHALSGGDVGVVDEMTAAEAADLAARRASSWS